MDLTKLESVLKRSGYSIDGGNSSHGSLRGHTTSSSPEVWLLVDGIPFYLTVNRVEDKEVNIDKYFNYYKG